VNVVRVLKNWVWRNIIKMKKSDIFYNLGRNTLEANSISVMLVYLLYILALFGLISNAKLSSALIIIAPILFISSCLLSLVLAIIKKIK